MPAHSLFSPSFGSASRKVGKRVFALPLALVVAVIGAFLLGGSQADAKSPNPPVISIGNSGWYWQNPKPQGDTLSAVSCPSTKLCYAVGADGTALKSGKMGSTTVWTGLQSGTSAALIALSCPSAKTCYALSTEPNKVIKTVDGGKTWFAQVPGIGVNLDAITCLSAKNCIATGDFGVVLTTTNGGTTWTKRTSGTTNFLDSVSCATTKICVAVGGGGAIVATTDGGATWAVQTSGTTVRLNGVSCNKVECVAVGASGTAIVRSLNSATWAKISGGTSGDLNGVSCAKAACIAVGVGGAIQSVALGAVVWTAQTSGTTETLLSIACAANTCTTVGTTGTILTATAKSGAATWTAQSSSATNTFLQSIDCQNTTTCVAVGNRSNAQGGYDGGIITTSDGKTWVNRSFTNTNIPLIGVDCANGTTICYAVGITVDNTGSVTGPAIEKSTDGGATWAAANPGTTKNFLGSVSCASATNCVAVGRELDAKGSVIGASAIYTTDGTTWNPSTIDGATGSLAGSAFYTVNCPTTTHCVAGGNDGNVYPYYAVSNDGGATWTSHSDESSFSLYPINSIVCQSATNCYAIDGGTNFYATTDGGTTFKVTGYVADGGLSLSCLNTKICVAVNAGFFGGGSIDATTNADSATSAIFIPQIAGLGPGLNSVSCATGTPNMCIAVGDSGTVVASTSAPLNSAAARTAHKAPNMRIALATGNAVTKYGVGAASHQTAAHKPR